jgi:hypothetical protein
MAVTKLVQLCHIGPKLRIFGIWIPKLSRLCHLDHKLIMYDIWSLNLHDSVTIWVRQRFRTLIPIKH